MAAKQNVLDVRGLSCPEPVVRTRQALAADPSGELVVITDNRVSVENIRRFVTGAGYSFTVANDNGDYLISVKAKQ